MGSNGIRVTARGPDLLLQRHHGRGMKQRLVGIIILGPEVAAMKAKSPTKPKVALLGVSGGGDPAHVSGATLTHASMLSFALSE